MGGGLLQLVAYGAQDVYLSGNPQITFFKVAYRRHTNFSMESIEQTFNGVATFGRRVTCQISRNGDLIHRMYLQVGLENASWEDKAYVGLALVKSVELEIGGQRIDKQYGDWMYIWNELSLDSNKREGFDDMVGGTGGILTTTATALVDTTIPNAEVTAVSNAINVLVTTNTAGTFVITSGTTPAPGTLGSQMAAFSAVGNNTVFDDVNSDITKIIDEINNFTDEVTNNINYSPVTKFSGSTTISDLMSKLNKIKAAFNTVGTGAIDAITTKINGLTNVSATEKTDLIDKVGAAIAAASLAIDKAASATVGVLYIRSLKSTVTDYVVAAKAACAASVPKTTMYIPLEFWFCRNPGLALPLIALQYHEVKVNLEFNSATDAGIKQPIYTVLPAPTDTTGIGAKVVTVTSVNTVTIEPKMKVAAIWVDYIFLDTDERRRFAQLSHEYLIEQLQFTGEENVSGSSNKVKLNFNHPVKELVWVMQQSTSPFGCYDDSGSKAVNGVAVSNGYVRTGMNLTESANIQLNGHDRFAVREGKYFNRVQPFQHHTNVPANKGINVYSFALKPEEHQPSGTLNFSRIDSAVLNVKSVKNPSDTSFLDPAKIRVYAVNYNVLRIMSGMGGLAYSN